MTDTDKLNRLSEECVRGLQYIEDRICEADQFRFTGGTVYAKSISAILALIAENEWLTKMSEDREQIKSERDEALCVLRGIVSGCVGWGDASGLLARIDAAE